MLREIFRLLTGTDLPKKPGLPARPRFVTYRVDNAEIAEALYHWHTEGEKARREIAAYVESQFRAGRLGVDPPLYKLDEQGRLHSVAYNGAMPDGWGGIPHTHWLEPKAAAVIAEVNALRSAPGRKMLHDLIGWPTLETKGFPPSEHGVIRKLNRMVNAYSDGKAVFIDVPHPDNFNDFPRIREQIMEWKKPDWLRSPQAANEPTPGF